MKLVIDEILFLEADSLVIGGNKIIGWRFNQTLRTLLVRNLVEEAALLIVKDMTLIDADTLIWDLL